MTIRHNTWPRMEADLTHPLCEVGLVPWVCLMVINYCQATLLKDGFLQEDIALLTYDLLLVTWIWQPKTLTKFLYL